ncbi:MAG: nickel pincer cofactor biosynthesis protein LarB [Deltaproteobacteria bacterium]|nr:nickel pincer cofactor biosynthesis protein LarB [Deltaproteobacteria bacterium]
MNKGVLEKLLAAVASGEMTVSDATDSLRHFDFEDIGFASIDHHRSLRKGFPETIFGQDKTADQVIGIMEKLAEHEPVVMVTRLDADKADRVCRRFSDANYHPESRILIKSKGEIPVTGKGEVLVMCAGTSDIPVAQEAYLTSVAMGNRTSQIRDVGVAGIHRLFVHREAMEKASVIIVAAGMEGALPSVVAGLVNRPIIGLPTSVGYGTSFSGLTALFAMLNSCASNVSVVNIDNGFGAGCVASTINHLSL